ncbi:glycine zipper 2TM domain-containing protein [Luteimonas aestuarii]|uniref:Glycine zipper 2TM domain-containing protein n=1 Tax=Luteimonas aestuarii TaxID=453837 RepID=A0A4R5TJY3_9GAMM|nr:glycine zipper 2TM domain-containing protein [Luteimonas aestuarii]TDK21548.1 glycine zipper 2TM domain-containing protein [Luteimonas aestuarii]
MKNNTLAIALASMLVGGVAVGAYHNSRDSDRDRTPVGADAVGEELPFLDRNAGAIEYADVIDVVAVTESQPLYATVLGSEPISETTTSSTPRQVCQDVVVQERLPERDGLVGGTVAGAVVGGLVGNQIGGGSGRRLATVAGAVGGGFAGREIDRRHVGGQVVERVDRQCTTVQDSSQSSRVVAYNVTYRTPEGETRSMRTGSKPGDRISLGSEQVVVGYDVTYRHDGMEHTVRMDQEPGDRLPVVDGEVMLRTASLDTGTTRS